MTMLFGRGRESGTFLDQALTALRRDGTAADKALAENFEADDRVCPDRQEAFVSALHDAMEEVRGARAEAPSDDALFKEAVNLYFDRKIRTSDEPEFTRTTLNRSNLLSEVEKGSIPDGGFVRLLSLNGLSTVMNWARDAGILSRYRYLRPITGPRPSKPDTSLDRWLDERLEGASPDRKEGFVEEVLDVLKRRRVDGFAHQPTWTTSFSAFEPHLDRGAVRWAQALGMHRECEPDQWLLLLAYPASAVRGPIVRPCVLDAGIHPCHYPTRACLPVATGGHPMDLRRKPPATTLLPEYIHVQIDHTIDHFLRAGSRLERTRAVPLDRNLAEERRCHRKLLGDIYPDVYPPLGSTPTPR